MEMVADQLEYVVGVDTHRDEHTLAVVVASTGAVVARRTVSSDARGYRQALRFAASYAPGARLWAVEGVGHYGAGLARNLSRRGETVLEVGRPSRDERRLRGKDDELDAVRAARAALTQEPLPRPRCGEHREAIRLLLLARRSAVDVRREALVQLRSVIVTAPDQAPRAAARSHARTPARALPPPARLPQRNPGRARGPARPAHTRPPSQGGQRRGRRARSRDPRPHTRPRTQAARPARRRPDRGRAAARRLVTPRTRPLRSRLRPTRRRRAHPRLERPNHTTPAQPRRRPPTQPRTAHDRPPPPPPRPPNQELHSPPRRRRQNPPRSHPATQALPRPPPLPTPPTTRATHGLTVIGASAPCGDSPRSWKPIGVCERLKEKLTRRRPHLHSRNDDRR